MPSVFFGSTGHVTKVVLKFRNMFHGSKFIAWKKFIAKTNVSKFIRLEKCK